jgi:ENTS family enterobactin (siderophore) exporter
VIIALLGAGWVFALMVALNVFAILALFPIPRTNAATRAARSQLATEGHRAASLRQGGLADIRDGIAYLKRERIILWLIGIHGTTQMLALPYQRLLPGFVAEVLSGSEDETAVLTGVLLSLTAVGALVGSLLIASLPDRQRGKLLIYSLVVFGIGLTAFSASNILLVSASVVLVLGVGQSMRQSLANILIQSHVEDDYRGRVSALMLMDDGLESLGIFAVALVADLAGSQWALGSVGVLLVAYGLLLWTSKPIRTMD